MSVALRYLEAWLRGNGAVAINNLMEDAATAEISRSQVWQWIHNGVPPRRRHPDHRRPGPPDRATRSSPRIRADVVSRRGRPAASPTPGSCSRRVALADDFADFLTVAAYELID